MALSYQQLLTAVPLILRAGHVPTIVGDAGIGKTALVQAVAQQLGARLFTTVVSLSEKGDLAIPIPPMTESAYITTCTYGRLADIQFGYTHTLIQIIQQAEHNPKQPILWFLDEFNRGTAAVQSELMNLVLQRQINDLVLPANVAMIIAENPDQQMSGFEAATYAVYGADAAINDRTTRLVMSVSVREWLAWASAGEKRPNIHPLIQQFISDNTDVLQVTNQQTDIVPTPRAWQRVSDNYYELLALPTPLQETLLFDLVAGDVGHAVATQFVAWIHRQTPGLTAAMIFEATPAGTTVPGDVLQEFQALSEVQKLTLTQTAVQTIDLLSDAHAGRFASLLDELAPDSQYALVKQLADQRLLERLFQSEAPNVVQLYQKIMDIAAR